MWPRRTALRSSSEAGDDATVVANISDICDVSDIFEKLEQTLPVGERRAETAEVTEITIRPLLKPEEP